MAEIPAKIRPTDFSICIKCQETKKNEKLSTPRELSSLESFLNSVNRRSELGSSDFVSVSQRLRGLTPNDLQRKGAKWHRTCYAETTHKGHIERDEKCAAERKQRGRPSTDSDSARLTRSSAQTFNRKECFFCQGRKTDETLHACQSENCGRSIKEIVEKSDNCQWKVQLADIVADGDFLARDVLYHNSCKTSHWRTFVQGPQRSGAPSINSDDEAHFIAAEMEFYDELQERIENGEYITTVQAETLYTDMMLDHGVQDSEISRRTLVTKITQGVPDIVITKHRGNLPSVLCSTKSGREAVDIARVEKDVKGDLTAVFKCSKVIRRIIIEARSEKPWIFKGSLDDSNESGIPMELMMLIRWILQGSKAATTESRQKDLRKSCAFISQSIMQEFKTSRQVSHEAKSESALSAFRRQLESPFSVGLSLWLYHNLRSQRAITLLSKGCAGMSYSRVTHVCSQIANAVQTNINTNGVFVPVGLVKGRPIRASADNIDKKVDTADGKNSFHAMASSVFQPTCEGETLVESIDLYKISAGALTNVPTTCIKLVKCNVEGNPKPSISPSYPSYKVGTHAETFESALRHDTAWMMARFFNRQSNHASSGPPVPEQTDVSEQTTIPPEIIAINDIPLVPGISLHDLQIMAEDSSSIAGDRESVVRPDSSLHHPQAVTVGETSSSAEDRVSGIRPGSSACEPQAVTVEMSSSSVDDRESESQTDPNNTRRVLQSVPVWSAYNSLLNTSSSGQSALVVIDKVFSLPIINSSTQEWPTLATTLDQLCRLNELVSGSDRKLVVTFDMDLYKRVLKLEYLDPKYKDKWVVCPGAFHTSLCAIRCLGRTIEGSGLDDAWVEAGLYSSVTVHQIINGNHYSRAIDAHEVTLQVLFDLWLDAFFSERPAVREALEASVEQLSKACASQKGVREAHQALLATMESMNLEKQLSEFDARHATNPMFQWARIYMRQVLTLLQFQRATRQGDWHLHLSSLEKLCCYFFIYDRHDYAQNIPEYIARMYQLQETDKSIWNAFLSQEFTVNTSNQIPFTRLGVDQAQEQQNKNLKGLGAINGITQSPATLLKYCMCAPELARIANEAETMVGVANQSRTEHHCLNQATLIRQEQAIEKLYQVLVTCNIFTANDNNMYRLMTKEIISKSIEESILGIERQGSSAVAKFVEERICGDTNLWDKMTKCNVRSWNSANKEINLQAKSDVLTLRATTGFMSRLLIAARSSRQVDLEALIGKYEFSVCNRILMKQDGSVHPTLDKSKAISVLENLPSNASPESSVYEPEQYRNTCLIIDGMAVVQELMAVKPFDNCKSLSNAFVLSIESKARKYNMVRVVFDNYTVTESLKEATRDRRRGSRVPVRGYKVDDTTKITNTKSFLGSTLTKASLTLYLAKALIVNARAHVITATHECVMSNRDGSLEPDVSSQEEADTLMILHAVEAAKAGFAVHIYSQDTDVLLLALRRVPLLGDKAAMVMGTGDRRRLITLQPIYDALGARKAMALCKWHALTGSDTTGHIKGKSKKACLDAFLKASPSIVDSVSALGTGNEPSDETIMGCVSFLCSLFCPKGVSITQPHILRWTLFKQQGMDKGVDLLPPTFGAWAEHVKRAHWQSAIWEQDLCLHPVVPDPTKLGWAKENDRFVPVLSKVAPAPAAVVELVRCSCGTSNPNRTNKCSSARCSCRVNDLACTELCRCEADVEVCQNINGHIDDEDIT